MNEIKCPNCGKSFQINESLYDSILKQIRNQEFDKELLVREEQFNRDKENAVKLANANFEKTLNTKELEIKNLQNELKLKEEVLHSKLEKHYSEEINKKDFEIVDLKNKLKNKENEIENAIKNAVMEKDKKIYELNNAISMNEKNYVIQEKNLKDSYEDKIKNKDEQIAYYKDFKARQSTKMIGESLEQHCYNEFNKLRPLFKNCSFEKDNDIKTGSKGDFIFRDFDDDGSLIVSIMFEMKNEADLTSSKHKNEDFFKELDKDRKEKSVNMQCLFLY